LNSPRAYIYISNDTELISEEKIKAIFSKKKKTLARVGIASLEVPTLCTGKIPCNKVPFNYTTKICLKL
jgi:hypothetical protein